MNAAGWSKKKAFSQFYLKLLVEHKSFEFVRKM